MMGQQKRILRNWTSVTIVLLLMLMSCSRVERQDLKIESNVFTNLTESIEEKSEPVNCTTCSSNNEEIKKTIVVQENVNLLNSSNSQVEKQKDPKQFLAKIQLRSGNLQKTTTGVLLENGYVLAPSDVFEFLYDDKIDSSCSITQHYEKCIKIALSIGDKTIPYEKISIVGVHPVYFITLLKISDNSSSGTKISGNVSEGDTGILASALSESTKTVVLPERKSIDVTTGKHISTNSMPEKKKILGDGLEVYAVKYWDMSADHEGDVLFDANGNVIGIYVGEQETPAAKQQATMIDASDFDWAVKNFMEVKTRLPSRKCIIPKEREDRQKGLPECTWPAVDTRFQSFDSGVKIEEFKMNYLENYRPTRVADVSFRAKNTLSEVIDICPTTIVIDSGNKRKIEHERISLKPNFVVQPTIQSGLKAQLEGWFMYVETTIADCNDGTRVFAKKWVYV